MISLHRVPDWRQRLERAIDDIRYAGFDWQSQHDCAIGLAGRAVHAVTDVDVIADWRGRYSSRRGALLAMKRAGFDNIADMAASLLPEIAEGPCMASLGDIAAIAVPNSPFGYALGVVNGERILVLRDEGVGTVDLLQATRAFRVG